MKDFLKRVLTRENLRDAGYVLLGLIVLFVLMNWVIMPLYTRQHQAIKVPDVGHVDFETALERLEDKDLEVIRAAEKFDANYPPETILFQNPEPGTPVKKGRRVYLTVGKGKRVIEMPRLVGTAERDSRFILQDNNLVLGNVEYDTDYLYPEGVVSAQSIPPGENIPVGTIVDLRVSLGMEPSVYIVPDLIGDSLDDSILKVKKAGLTPGSIDYQDTTKLLPGTVIDQSIAPGLEVAKGDTIRLVVSRLPNQQEEETSSW
jgi:serine/threonine-protein kinase